MRGATISSDFLSFYGPVSIHAPVRGATKAMASGKIMADVSINAPVRGATLQKARLYGWLWCFNPRAREGRDVNP